MKKLRAILIVLAVLIAVVVGVLLFGVDMIAKAGVEKGSTYAMGVDTTVDSLNLRLMSGGLTMDGMTVANPEGFTSHHFLRTGEFDLQLQPDTILGDPVVIDSFELDGYVVQTAGDGERGLEMMEHDLPDVVVLDYKMPGLNGLEVLKRIKKSNPKLPVIMITAYDQELNVSDLTKEGIHTILTKPLDPNRVRMCVENTLEEQKVM